MSLDTTFCASPNCKNECGRQITKEIKDMLDSVASTGFSRPISYSYFCGEPEKPREVDSDH